MARKFHALDIVPSLSGITDSVTKPFKTPVKGVDVAVGAGAAMAGIWATKTIINKYLVGKIPASVQNYVPAIAGVLTGAALYMAQKKSSRAAGHAVGAISTGVAINAWNLLKTQFPSLADIVDLRLAGVILNDPGVAAALAPSRQMHGLIMDDRGHLAGTDFAALAAVGEVDDSPIELS